MAEYITAKLPNRVIVVTKNCDRKITVVRRDPVTGELIDWDAEVHMKVDVDRSSPTHVSATVTGSTATIRLESTLLDTVKNGTTWRVIMSQYDVPRFETPVMVGIFERNDGR